jgi:hypothetical protein
LCLHKFEQRTPFPKIAYFTAGNVLNLSAPFCGSIAPLDAPEFKHKELGKMRMRRVAYRIVQTFCLPLRENVFLYPMQAVYQNARLESVTPSVSSIGKKKRRHVSPPFFKNVTGRQDLLRFGVEFLSA